MSSRVLPTLALVALSFGCGQSSSPTAPTTTTPPPTTTTPTPAPATSVAMDGVVAETAPTTGKTIPGATIRITSGPEAGQSRVADGNGYYAFQELTPGSFTVEVSAPNYESTSFTVTRAATTTGRQDFNIRPARRELQETFTGEISGGSSKCTTREGFLPCSIVTLDVHHDGMLEATLDWLPTTTDLDLDLYEGTTRLATSDNIRYNFETITSQVSAGTSYQLRIYYYDGSLISRYTLRVRRPS